MQFHKQKNEMEKIIVSVITVVYNDKQHIEKTINNVLSQDYPFIEYIIIDGNSNDGTKEIITQYSSKIIFISEPDSGIYNAMNKGIKLATGSYLIFMNSGDTFTNNTIISQVISYIKDVQKLPNIIYGNYREFYNGKFSPIIPARSYKKIWYGAFASHQSTFYNRDFLTENKLIYDESYKIAADYKLNLEIVKYSKDNILQIPICISDFDKNGVSSTNQSLGLTEANRARKEVLDMGLLKRESIIILQICARWLRTYCKGIYKLLRMS